MGSKEARSAGEGKEKVTIVVHEGRRGGKGIFGLEKKADERVRQTKLQCLAEEIETYDRGYIGSHRRCPRCGYAQRDKGAVARVLAFDCGTLTVRRAYYLCPACQQTKYPLDEQLGLAPEQERESLRKKFGAKGSVGSLSSSPASLSDAVRE